MSTPQMRPAEFRGAGSPRPGTHPHSPAWDLQDFEIVIALGCWLWETKLCQIVSWQRMCVPVWAPLFRWEKHRCGRAGTRTSAPESKPWLRPQLPNFSRREALQRYWASSTYLYHGWWVLEAWSHRWHHPGAKGSSSAPSNPGPTAGRPRSTTGHAEEEGPGRRGRGGGRPEPPDPREAWRIAVLELAGTLLQLGESTGQPSSSV